MSMPLGKESSSLRKAKLGICLFAFGLQAEEGG